VSGIGLLVVVMQSSRGRVGVREGSGKAIVWRNPALGVPAPDGRSRQCRRDGGRR
jgi:hypothetical protein